MSVFFYFGLGKHGHYLLYHFHNYAVQAAVLCGSTSIFCRRKAAVVLRKVAEGLRFDCGQCGSSFGSLRYILRFSDVVLCGRKTTENFGLNGIIEIKWYFRIMARTCSGAGTNLKVGAPVQSKSGGHR